MKRPTGPQLELVRKVLNRWDPIGVAEYVSNEYDNYLAQVAGMLIEQLSRDEIARSLHELETDRMGMTGDYVRCVQCAEELLALELPPGEF